jgi:hypothetical protein
MEERVVPACRRVDYPFGAPGDGPPCIRHLPFAIAGDRASRSATIRPLTKHCYARKQAPVVPSL